MFENPQLIGEGGFGKVFKARHKIDNSIYAIKREFIYVGINENLLSHKVFREVNTMTTLDHINVVR